MHQREGTRERTSLSTTLTADAVSVGRMEQVFGVEEPLCLADPMHRGARFEATVLRLCNPSFMN